MSKQVVPPLPAVAQQCRYFKGPQCPLVIQPLSIQLACGVSVFRLNSVGVSILFYGQLVGVAISRIPLFMASVTMDPPKNELRPCLTWLGTDSVPNQFQYGFNPSSAASGHSYAIFATTRALYIDLSAQDD